MILARKTRQNKLPKSNLILPGVKEFCENMMNTFVLTVSVQLSNTSISARIEEIANDIECNLNNDLKT